MLLPFCCGTKFLRPAIGCGSGLSATNQTAMASEPRLKSWSKDRVAMQKYAPEAVSRVRATRESILAWVRQRKLTPSSSAGRADKSTNLDRKLQTKRLSSEREVASLNDIRKRHLPVCRYALDPQK